MQKARLTKTLSIDRDLVRTIERVAKQERRSFTRQVEIMLEHALERAKQPETAPEAEKTA